MSCLRYRIDSDQNKRYTTIELIAEEAVLPSPVSKEIKRIFPHPLKVVSVEISLHEYELRNLIKYYGGKWDKKALLWNIQYKYVQKLSIEARVRWPEEE